MLLSASPASAQGTTPDPDADATMRFGPLSIKSTLALTNMGIDTNVFNQADDEAPQSDFTMTFSPDTNLWLRLGRTWVSGTIEVDWVYYNKFATERSANSHYRIGVARTFNRLSMRANASRRSTRDRPGWEIDARSQRFETDYDGAAEVRVLANTNVGIRASRRRTDFDDAAFFREASLAQELNRTTTATGLIVRHDLTPLTTVGLEVIGDRERFVFSSFRDSDSTRVVGSVRFQPLALISGTAVVGFRRFTPLPADVPPYRGAVAAVDLSYSLLGTTRFGIQATRDIQHSFEFTQPYYLETGFLATIQQQVYGPFDVLGRAGARSLGYANRTGLAVPVFERTDRIRTFGIGGGYRIGVDKRLGFTIDRDQRRSVLDRRAYTGLRFGVSMTYET